jgi:hypothetical protein
MVGVPVLTAGATARARPYAGRQLIPLRYELWVSVLRPERLVGFTSPMAPDAKPEKLLLQFCGTLFDAEPNSVPCVAAHS